MEIIAIYLSVRRPPLLKRQVMTSETWISCDMKKRLPQVESFFLRKENPTMPAGI